MKENHFFSPKNLSGLPKVFRLFENDLDNSLAKRYLENLVNRSVRNLHLGHNFTFNHFSNCVFNIYVNKDNE